MSGIDEKTVKNYLEILKETFLITIHPPWFTNLLKELVKMPKVYFLDAGVETEKIKFWRTKNRREVDVILDVDDRVMPVERKYKNTISRSDTLGLRRFIDMYPDAEKPVLVTWGSNVSISDVIVRSPFNLKGIVWRKYDQGGVVAD